MVVVVVVPSGAATSWLVSPSLGSGRNGVVVGIPKAGACLLPSGARTRGFRGNGFKGFF